MITKWSRQGFGRTGIAAIAAVFFTANAVAVFPYTASAVDIQAGEVWNRRPVDNYAQVHSVKTSSDGQTIFSATRQGVYRSEDGGTTWMDITGPIREGSFPTWIEGNTSHIDVSASGDDVIATYREYVYISHDSGDNWTEVSDWGGGSDQSSIIYVAMSSDGQTMALISNDSKLYLSQDGGATFGIVADFVPSSLRDVVVSSDGQYIAVVSDNSVYVSSDNGTTWDQTYENGDSYAPTSLRMSDDGSTMAFSDYEQGVRISTDYGQTWGVYDNGLASFEIAEVFVAPQSGDVYMIINNNEIYRTQNSGTTWQPYDDGISDDCYGITDMSYDEDTVVATCVDGTVLKVSQNGGATWQNSTLTKEDVRHYWTSIDSSSDNQIQLAGSGGIDNGSTGRSGDDNLFVSYDSGVTWTAAESAGRSNWVDVAVSSDG